MITIMNSDYDGGRIVVGVIVMMVYCNTTNFLLIFLAMLLVLARKKNERNGMLEFYRR